jgi:Ca-activated chloride channel family protein
VHREDGGTNIGAASSSATRRPAIEEHPRGRVRVVLLLSDGHANAGITARTASPLALDAFQRGIQTSSFGLGDRLRRRADERHRRGRRGRLLLPPRRRADRPALGTELDNASNPVATAVEVRVRLKKDVELLHVYGSRRLSESEAARVRAQEVAADNQAEQRDHIKQDRQDDTEGGMRFFIPAFAPDDATRCS